MKDDSNDYHVNAMTFAGLDEITAINVGRFAKALAMKLLAAKKKYGYTDGWTSPHWESECRSALIEHIDKGDPIDVAAFAMFMWKHHWSTAPSHPAPTSAPEGFVPESITKLPAYWESVAELPSKDNLSEPFNRALRCCAADLKDEIRKLSAAEKGK